MASTDPETQVTRRCRDTWYVPPEPQEAERNSKNTQTVPEKSPRSSRKQQAR